MRTIAIALCWAMIACQHKESAPAAVEVEPPEKNLARPQIGYPEGPWWDDDNQNVMLAGSHILVSHRDAKPIHRLIWAQPADRSRDEAMQRAWALYLELRAQPERFAELAARASDEPITRAFGGALGAFYTETVPPVFIDAFAAVAEGEVTRPVETEQGFHVLRRLKPPAAPTQLELAHINIKYEGMTGWQRQDHAAVGRTREEARAIAERIARQAQQAPDQFAKLAREYSDADDALRDGDMGSLSTYDMVESDARLFAVAERLPVGGVSDVIGLESTGFHIVRRMPASERPVLAASAIALGYVESQVSKLRPNAEQSRAETEQLAKRILKQLARHPDQFDALRTEHCAQMICNAVVSWTKGRRLTAFELATERLGVGEISAEPVDSPLGLLIVRREDPARHPPPPSTATPTFIFPRAVFVEQGAAPRPTGS